jgi:uncharacterized protein YigA (DUF484 family)
MAQLVPRLRLRSSEAAAVVEILVAYLRDKSSMVKIFAMQALADLASNDQKLKSQIRTLLEELTQSARQPCAPADANFSANCNRKRVT